MQLGELVRLEAQGSSVYRGEKVVSGARIAEALGSAHSEQTALLVPFFGPTMAGDAHFIEVLALDLSRALLGGVSYEWVRPFREGETVQVEVSVDKVFDKASNRFGVVVAEFSDSGGALIQRQTATFIEPRAA